MKPGELLELPLLEHLADLRRCLIRALAGFGVAFLGCMVFSLQLWSIVQAPARDALQQLGIEPPDLIAFDPTEQFSIIWIWTPFVAAIFLAAPWLIYQAWAFVAPGLYTNERRIAIGFLLSTTLLFLAGGLFAYFVAFRQGLVFLLGIGLPVGVRPMVSISLYFSVFVNVMLGVALTFELPVAIFFLTLLGIASPSFLLTHARYALLAIVMVAALITPSQDFFNLTLLAVPMALLYFLGVFASYLLVLRREEGRFPWGAFLKWMALVATLAGLGAAIARRWS